MNTKLNTMTKFEIDKQNTFMYGDSTHGNRLMTRAYWNLVGKHKRCRVVH